MELDIKRCFIPKCITLKFVVNRIKILSGERLKVIITHRYSLNYLQLRRQMLIPIIAVVFTLKIGFVHVGGISFQPATDWLEVVVAFRENSLNTFNGLVE